MKLQPVCLKKVLRFNAIPTFMRLYCGEDV